MHAAHTRGLRPRWFERLAAWPAVARFGLIFALVAVAHLTLLKLPYYWDELGYYIPAALDFYHRWTLIPSFTNAHPPLPNVVLGLLWHVFGYHVVVTRLTACAFAAGGLLALYELSRRLIGPAAALAVALLTAAFPIWFAQSSLAHADIFAAGLTLGGLALYLTNPEQTEGAIAPGEAAASSNRRLVWTAVLFCLAVLAKETALLQPVVLALLELLWATRSTRRARGVHLRWAAALATPIPVIVLWFAYHRWKTGFTFGNPTFLRYNATANFTAAHIGTALLYRAIHLFWQRNIWIALLLAAACFLLPRRAAVRSLPSRVTVTLLVLIVANWLAFSVMGGALLTRYLLPVYPLLILLCAAVWQEHTEHWPWLAVITGAAFITAIWLNPPTYFAPEDNLTYRDMILVHEDAIHYLDQHYPHATVLSAWPAASELFRPELGYTDHSFTVYEINDFTPAEVAKAAEHPGRFDTALVFTTHFVTPAFRHYLLTHPRTKRGREYQRDRDMTPAEIAALLGGRIVWREDRGGEWAAILRFNRDYDAMKRPPPPSGSVRLSAALSSSF